MGAIAGGLTDPTPEFGHWQKRRRPTSGTPYAAESSHCELVKNAAQPAGNAEQAFPVPFMKPRIQKAEASWHSVILTFATRATRVQFRRKAETATSDLGRKGQDWKPLTVLPPGFQLSMK
jgi:hypothetical protein